MTAAEFIDQAKAALDDFGERGMCREYTLLGYDGFFKLRPTHKSNLLSESWWQMFQEFCAREGKEIM
jgi:hypothetical protein